MQSKDPCLSTYAPRVPIETPNVPSARSLPYLLHLRSSDTFIVSTICMAVFADILLYSIVIPVIPFALNVRAGVPIQDIQQWLSILLAAYGGACLVGSPIMGCYADRCSSRRVPMLIGLVALVGATVLLCLARSMALLVLGRILQGLSASVVWTVGMALLVDTVGERRVGEAMGWVGLTLSAAIFVGPLIGGVVYRRAGYIAVFYSCFALLALDIILRLALIEKKVAARWLVTKNDRQSHASQDPLFVPGITIDATNVKDSAISSEVDIVRSPPSCKTPKSSNILKLFRSRRMWAAMWGTAVQASLVTALDTILALFVQRTFGWDSFGSGLVFLAIAGPAFLGPLIGKGADHYGSRWLAVTGFLIGAPLWVCLRFVYHDFISQKVLLCALLALIGLCLALIIGPLSAETTNVIEAMERKDPGCFGVSGAYAQGYAMFFVAYSTGTLIGPFWAGYVESVAGWSTVTWTLALWSGCGAIPIFWFTGGPITRKNAHTGDERALGVVLRDSSRMEQD